MAEVLPAIDTRQGSSKVLAELDVEESVQQTLPKLTQSFYKIRKFANPGLKHNLIKTATNIYRGHVRWRGMPCLVDTKTEGLFGKTDILYEVSNMYLIFIRFKTYMCINQTEASPLLKRKLDKTTH